MAELTLHRTYDGGYWVGSTGLWLTRTDGGWRFTWPLGILPQTVEWIENNPDVDRRCFRTRREAMALLAALNDLDPLPEGEAWGVPSSSIRPRGSGRYEIQDQNGEWHLVVRTECGGWKRAEYDHLTPTHQSLWFAALSIRNRP